MRSFPWRVINYNRGHNISYPNNALQEKSLKITIHICIMFDHFLVGGFNPFEKYLSKWESSPNRGENKKYLKPPPSF